MKNVEKNTEKRYTLKIKLKEILEERDMTQSELHELSGIGINTIGGYVRNVPTRIEKETIATVFGSLGITDMNEVFEIVEID